jgi:hypothetical protein
VLSIIAESEGSGLLREIWPGQRYARVPCVPPYCEFLCEERPDLVDCTPPPRASRASRTCTTSSGAEVAIFPITFAVPAQDVVACVPAKSQAFSTLVPGNRSTYIFGPGDEPEYKRDYRKSYFAFTWRKAGWDCMRHYEILASGALPYFTDLVTSTPGVLSSLPKLFLNQAMRMPGKRHAIKDYS